VLRFTLKMLSTGKTALPAQGIGELPKQLAARLPLDAVRNESPVSRLLRDGERIVGVETSAEQHEADVVVTATDAPTARSSPAGCARGVGRAALRLLRGGGSKKREEDHFER
jgi:phytoene dehydrogenase-like protein